MDLLNDTPFAFGHLAWQLQPPRWSLTLVVKATFDLVPDGVATPADEPRLVTGDEPFDDPERDNPSLRFESDLAQLKPRGECLLAGTCHAPAEAAVAAVSFRVGAVHRRFVVFGERHFDRAAVPTSPAPFRTCTLQWEHAFGGPDLPDNPVGRGVAPVVVDGREVVPLPFIEDPDALIRSPGDRPAPAGAGPIPRAWRARAALAGTYDEAWRRSRWPWFPVDFDPAYFQAAPPAQRIDGYWRGDEAVELTGLSATHPVLRSRLPGRRVRCFVTRNTPEGKRTSEVRMNLDTITLDGDARQALCLWRGLSPVTDDTLGDVLQVALLSEALDAPRSTDDCLARIAALAAERAAEDGADEEPPPPAAALAAAPLGLVAALAAPAPAAAAVVDAPVHPGRAEVLRLRSHGQSLAGLDLTGADLAGLDLSRADFSGAILAGASLRGATLYRTVFDEADLSRADLAGATLQRASLARADLTGADLAGATLNEAVLTDAVFARASLRDTHLTEVRSAGADYREADLEGVDASDGDFDGADFTGARAVRARFDRATLREATLASVDATDARFERCVAPGLRAIDGARFVRASFAHADLARANFADGVLDEATFAFAALARADFSRCALVKCSFDGSSARDACFDDARLVGASARRADLMSARFEGADLSWCDLRGANLFEAEFYRAKTDHAQVELAVVQRTKLEAAR